jgi:transposase
MPTAHAEHVAWTPERIARWARNTGPATAELCKAIIARSDHPEQGFRACLGVLRLASKYTAERLEKACARALLSKAPSYRGIRSILQNNLDTASQKSSPKPTALPAHENIRGAGYYH